jgi:glycosyltransferase involved in cell wall biosynthesis
VNLSVIILTRDEEKNLPFALDSLAGTGAEVFVIDSGSADRTCEIARDRGCKVLSHPFETHARQLNWAIDNLALDTDWVMRLDADERLSEALKDELVQRLATFPPEVSGLMLKLRVFFWGRWIRHGGYYPTWLLRIWRKGAARCDDRAMDEHMLVSSGKIDKLENDIIDENRKGIAFWIDKHNRFSDNEVASLQQAESLVTSGGAGAPTARKRLFKNRFYGRSPRFLRAFLYWFFRYFILLGFLDGLAGFVFHFLQGFWYRLVIDAKIHELERARTASAQR